MIPIPSIINILKRLNIKAKHRTNKHIIYWTNPASLHWIGEEAVTGFIPNNITNITIITINIQEQTITYLNNKITGWIQIDKLNYLKINERLTNKETFYFLFNVNEWYPHLKYKLYKIDAQDYIDNEEGDLDDYTRRVWGYNWYMFYENSVDDQTIQDPYLDKVGPDKTRRWFK